MLLKWFKQGVAETIGGKTGAEYAEKLSPSGSKFDAFISGATKGAFGSRSPMMAYLSGREGRDHSMPMIGGMRGVGMSYGNDGPEMGD